MSYEVKRNQRKHGARASRGLLGGASIAAALVALGIPSVAHGADRYWDANGTAVGTGGTGTWNLGNLNWSPSGDGVSGPYVNPWSNSALDNAIFAGTAGTVTLGAPITVHNLTFSAANFILSGSTLTLGGTSPSITTTTGNTTINSVIAGTSGLIKLGSAALYLNGINTFTGDIQLNLGSIYAANDTALGAAPNNIFTAAGAQVRLSIGGTATNRTVTIGDGGILILEGAGAGSALITGNGRVSVAASGVTMSNDNSTYTGQTVFSGCNGVCSARFTSIRNLGEASSLGAPTDPTLGTIIYNQQSQYSDSLIYLGDGDSSNRDWDINGNAALVRNQGTGTLSITGNIDISTGGSFSAETADFELLGVLSGGSYGFGGNAGHTITLGGANTYTGTTSIGAITVFAPVLADAGVASSFGAGSNPITIGSAGILSYTGGAGASNRAWTIGGTTAASVSGSILNDGTGDLDLSGAVTFGGAANNNLTLGGAYTGSNILSGVISGLGNIVSDGSGAWVLSGANTYTGTVTVQSGTLAAGSAQAFGTPNTATVNGGTLDLGSFDTTFTSLSGTGGSIALGSATMTVNGSASGTFAGSITGTGGLLKRGTSALTLTGANAYTGATTVNGGTLALDFSPAGGPTTNILSSASALTMTGGALVLTGAAGEANSQSFNGLNITAGSNKIASTSGAGGSMTLNLGAITRTGGLVDFTLPDSGAITTSNTALGGWATVNGADYAKVVGGNITAFTTADYTGQDDASLWAAGQFITDDDGHAGSFFNTVNGSVQLGGLRYTQAAASTVTIDAGQTLGTDGTIIVASSVGANDQTITGGSLTGAAGGSVLGLQQNGGGNFTIASTITDNGAGVIGFTKAGTGTATLSGLNTYTGVTTLSGGRLQITSLANGGAASSIGASAADSSNLVLESGTLAYTGGTDATTNRGFTLVNGGAGAPMIEVASGRTIEFSGQVTSADNAGLTKTGAGTLVLSNAANDYVGVTTITGSGSTLSVNTLTDGGIASGIGAATSDSTNIVLSEGGGLQYTGGTATTDRGFTLASNVGRIDVADAGTTLTVSGLATGTGSFTKDGDGTLILSGTNTYTGDNVVNAGTLKAGSAKAFGPGIRYMTVNAGATLDLGGFDISAGGLAGGGTVLLGGNTLTTAGGQAAFTGTITGTGGFTRGPGSYTQTISGCNNSYTGITTIQSSLAVDCIANGGDNSSIGASGADSANLVLDGGTLTYTGANVTTDRGFTLARSSTVSVSDVATTLEVSGPVVGAGALYKNGAGTLVLSGANTYTGSTRVLSGILKAGSEEAFGTPAAMILDNVAGVTLDLAGFDTSVYDLEQGGPAGGNISLGGATLTITSGNNSATSYFAGAISGIGSLIKNGTGTQRLRNCDSDYSGVTTINGGILEVTCLPDGGTASSIGSSSAAASNLVLNGGTLRYAGTGGSTDRQFTLGPTAGNALDASGTGAINFTSSAPLTFSGTNTAQTLTLTGTNTDDNILAAQITNDGSGLTALTKTGAGTWILTNPNSNYTGVTTISGGVLGVDKLADGGLASSLGASTSAAANLVIGNNSTLRYTGAGDTTNRLFTLAAGVTFLESSGTGAVVFTDTGAVTLQGNNQARTIALGGTNTGNNTLAGSIGDAGTGITTLAKNDSGTWVLTGTHTYTGSTNINAGILSIGAGGTTGSIASTVVNDFGTLVFNRSDSLTYAGTIVGTGALRQSGTGTTILTGDSSYTGGTTIAAGTLQLGNGGTSGSIVGDVTDNGMLVFNRSDTISFDGIISGSGAVTQNGTGTTILTASNSYAGGTTIDAGTLQISSDDNLGDAAGGLTFDGGTLQTTADITSARAATLVSTGTIDTNALTNFNLSGVISGAGSFTKAGAGTLTLTADNSYTGGTTIAAGTLQLGNGGTTGSILGDVTDNGALVFNRSDDISFDGLVSGTGAVIQNGSGIVTLTADNSYGGSTTINAGTLRINGDQSAATGLVAVSAGATLGGSGTIGGDVNIVSGGILAPGNSPGTLTINGNLLLASGSVLNYEFGEANVEGGTLNDLVNVGGNLRLDGTINVTVPTGGTFGGGIYRVFNYDGTLTDNGLDLGSMPSGSNVVVQTSVAGQVNLVNSNGLALAFWDGDAGPKFNDVVNGGSGTWHLGGTDNNWTGIDGNVNAAYADGAFATFAGTGGTVIVDNTDGPVTASGMQFASDGYTITGDPITLTDAQSEIRVGDGTTAGAGFTTTIDAALNGNAQLVKTDAGTLILNGTNGYTGGTAIDGGTLRISSDGNLGDAAGALNFDGGTLETTANIASARAVTLTGAGTLLTDAGTTFTLSSGITGAGALTKSGTGTLLLTGDATHSGGTTISAGTLQVGNGGTTGSIIGNIVDNGALIFNRSNALTYADAISGTGTLAKTGAGTLTMTGISTYTGATAINAGQIALQSGGQINGTASLTVDGGGIMTVSGADASLIAGPGNSVIAGSANSSGTLSVDGGATASFANLDLANGSNSFGVLDISGAGSQVTQTGSVNFGRIGQATVNVLDGGAMISSGGSTFVGGQLSTGNGFVTVSGTGSTWSITNALNAKRGTITIADGGVVTAGSSIIGFNLGIGINAPSADMTVTGAGSRFETTGALAITNSSANATRGTLTIADSGVVKVGSGTLQLGLGDATLNIGGAEGDAAAHAGTLDATAVTFAAAGNRINFNHDDSDYLFSAAISGAGMINQDGSGSTVLTGANSYTGTTTVNAGSLYINGDQSTATGLTTVNAGAALGGMGTIGGDVTVADGTLNPGDLGLAPGTLGIKGNLALSAGSTLNVSLGQANIVGGPLNDLVDVAGALVLAGTLNVQTTPGGTFDPGVYRVINYGGLLTDNGLAIGSLPSPDFYLQTSVANQVNLVNTAGLQFRYWDGTGAKNDGVIDGGDGVWQRSTGNDNWVDDGSIPNAPFADDAFAVFMGAAGNVAVDGGLGAVETSGMQFLTDGYSITGDAITLVGSQATIRVGDGTTDGADITTTIDAELTGSAQLAKTDLGTLILTGANSYTGGTALNGGVLQVASDNNLGDAAGGLSFDGGTLQTTASFTSSRAVDLAGAGTILTDDSTSLTLGGPISGAGSLTKVGTGTLTLTGANSYTGDTSVNAGTLFVNGDQTAATGMISVSSGAILGGMGRIGGNVVIADGATLDPGSADGTPGALTIGGNLVLTSGATLAMQFGQADTVGGALNDLIQVSGNLTLDGTLDVTVPTGGTFGPGVYRVINYGGVLTNNGLSLGTMPADGTNTIQTSIAGQVNLVNSSGLALNFWDGAAGPKFNHAIDGGDGLWQNGAGNDNWTDSAGAVNAAYDDGTFAIFAGVGGKVTVDNSLGGVTASGMQFASDGYTIQGDALTLAGPQSTIRVGDGTSAGAAFTATIATNLTGATQVVKTDLGTLILSGTNGYTGGTAIEGGTLQIAADANLGYAAGGVDLAGGTLHTTATFASDRAFTLTGDSTIRTDQDTTLTLNNTLSGTGALTKDGTGTLRLTGDSGAFAAPAHVAGGTLAVDGILGGTIDVASAGRLEGIGRVGGITNTGVVAPGGSAIGTLTVAGDYVGNGGTLEIQADLGGDNSAADRLIVAGATSGTTQVTVANRNGLGAQTVEGIKIIDIAGASNGTFTLHSDYLFQGAPTVVAGAYGYRLYKNGVATPDDGDWYLRSALLDPGDPGDPTTPLFQPGVPVYEAYAKTLQALNDLPTLQQRVGNRSWAGGTLGGTGIWGRMDGQRYRPQAAFSTSRADTDIDTWKMQIGADTALAQGALGTLIGGVTAQYGKANMQVRSVFGNGSVKTDGYALGATLTWYGLQGFYADAQAQFSWYNSDLKSAVLGTLVNDNNGKGEAVSLELGKRTPLGGKLSITPQVQIAYSNVDFDRFADRSDALVAASKGDSLKTRWGLSIDRQASWDSTSGDTRRSHLYGVASLTYEWLDGTRVEVTGTGIANRDERLWAEAGLGASYSWNNGRFTLYGETSADTAVKNFGDSYGLKGTAGFRIRF